MWFEWSTFYNYKQMMHVSWVQNSIRKQPSRVVWESPPSSRTTWQWQHFVGQSYSPSITHSEYERTYEINSTSSTNWYEIYDKVIIMTDARTSYTLICNITTYHTNLVLWKTYAFSTNGDLVHEAVQFSCLWATPRLWLVLNLTNK